MGLVGLTLIAAMAIWGADIRRAARSGPMWKRKLVAAGLLLLTMMGVGSCVDTLADKSTGQSATLSDAAQRKQLIAKAWRDVDAAWQFGTDYAFGRHGPWPFDKAAKTAILKQTEQFDTHVATLERLGELKNIEADALRLEWDFIQERIEVFTAADLRKGYLLCDNSCRYDTKNAKELLPHLVALSKAEKVNREVVKMVLKYSGEVIRNLEYDPGHVSYGLYREGLVAHDKLLAAYLKLKSRTDVRSAELDKHDAWKMYRAILVYEETGRLPDINANGSQPDPDAKVELFDPGADNGQVDSDDDIGLFPYLAGASCDGLVPAQAVRARKELDSLLKKGALCAAEVKALCLMLPLFDPEEYKARNRSFLEPEPVKEDPWTTWFWKLAEQKSISRGLREILVSAAETRLKLAMEWDTGLTMLFSDKSDVRDIYALRGYWRIQRSLARIRKSPLSESADLRKSEDWKKIARAHAEVTAIAKRAWCVTRLDKRRIGELFEPLDKSISALVAKGLLTKAEAEILQLERRFMLEVARYTGSYQIAIMTQTSACNRLSRRSELLDKLALLDRPDWRVADYILPAVQGDLLALCRVDKDPGASPDSGLFDSDPPDDDEATETSTDGAKSSGRGYDYLGRPRNVIEKMIAIRARARAQFTKLRAKFTVREKSLAQTRQWRNLTRVWRDAQARTSWDTYQVVSNQLGAQRLTGRLKNTLWDIEALRRAGLLSDPEAGLLSADVELFIEGVESQLTWEEPVMVCYDAGYPSFPIYPERWTTLGKRIGLLARLADSQKVRPEVVAKLLYVLQKDISRSDDRRERLSEEE